MHYIVTFTFFRELRGGDVEAVKGRLEGLDWFDDGNSSACSSSSQIL
jgi:hypothetical protein